MWKRVIHILLGNIDHIAAQPCIVEPCVLKPVKRLLLHSQCVTNIVVSQAFSSWSNVNVGRLRFDQHLVK